MIRFQRNGKQFTWEGVTSKVMSSEIIGDFGVYEWYEASGGWWLEDPRPLCTEFGLWELAEHEAK